MTPANDASFTIATAPAPGAIGVACARGDVAALLERLEIALVNVGAVALRRVPGIDDAVIARPTESTLVITPHAGPAVMAQLAGALERAGARADPEDALALYPEAAGEVEALALLALSRAASPRAAPLLLDQPRRWAKANARADELRERSRLLDRLINPPLVVCAGPANVGKSTLLNVLAGRTVSIVADEPGVTRDHVGAVVELDGLAVRWVDAPGLRAPESDVEAAAIDLARETIAAADLVILAGDAGRPAAAAAEFDLPRSRTLLLGLRADLGPMPGAEFEVRAIAPGGPRGLGALALAVRERLVPDAALDDPLPWLFDERLPAAARRDAAGPR